MKCSGVTIYFGEIIRPVVALLFAIALASDVFSQITAFTYQGRLNDGSIPATGRYDFTFSLFNSAVGGDQQGNAVTNSATVVSNGLFSVILDFGNQFPGTDRWLAIGVRTNGNGAFILLSPRQAITPTPYAVFASSANMATVANSVSASNITGSILLFGNGQNITNVNATTMNFPASSSPGVTSVRVGDFFIFGTTNAEPGRIGLSSTVHGPERGVAWLGMGSGDVVLDPGYVNGRGLQIGNSGNSGAYIYFQYGMFPDPINTNGFSHPVAWRSLSYSDGLVRSHYPGIASTPSYGNTSTEGQLVFYAKVPYWSFNNKQQTAPTTAGTEIFRMSTNGIVAALDYAFKGGNFTIQSNALSRWPTAPATRGDAVIVSSNGYPYILLSTNGTSGSTTWTGTNKLGW